MTTKKMRTKSKYLGLLFDCRLKFESQREICFFFTKYGHKYQNNQNNQLP